VAEPDRIAEPAAGEARLVAGEDRDVRAADADEGDIHHHLSRPGDRRVDLDDLAVTPLDDLESAHGSGDL
jgi:hypothetical protein